MKNNNRLLSVLLAISVLLSGIIVTGTMPVAEGSPEEEITIWDGTFATGFAGGTGKANDPYLIENGAQLATALDYSKNTVSYIAWNAHFALTKDIYLNDISKIDWKTGEAEEGYTPNSWISNVSTDGNSGYLHGNGYTIYGLYVNDTTSDKNHGLVPQSWSGFKFYDVGVDYAFIKSKKSTGFFIGYGKSPDSTISSFENCWVGENSTLISTENTASGFVCGQFKQLTFENCYSLANVSGATAKNGAFAGDVWGGPTMWFKNCYAIGAFYKNHGGTITNSYSTEQTGEGITKVVAANMVGAAAQASMPMLGSAFAVSDKYPVLKSQRDIDTAVWGGFLSQPADADENSEYEIYTPEEMAWYAKNGGKAVLMNDLYLNDLTVTITDGSPVLTKASDDSAIDPADNSLLEWFGTGTALGAVASLVYNFNGDGNVIYGLYHNQPGDGKGTGNYAGIFNQVATGASIYGVGIENAYMVSDATWAAALLIGRENNATFTVDSCYTGANTYHKGKDVAGICGGGGTPSAPATYKNTYSLTTLSGTGKANGLVADNWSNSAANFYSCFTSHSSAYRYGVNKGGVYANAGRGSQNKMPLLGEAYVLTEKGVELKIFADSYDENLWNGFAADSFAQGKGTQEEPYLISNAAELARAVAASQKDTYYKLTNDIYLNNISKINWDNGTALAGYKARSWFDDIKVQGNFDGDGHMVYGLYRYNGSATQWGVGGTALFPVVANTATLNVTKMGIDYAYVCGWHGGGAFVGNGPNDNTIDSYLNISESFVGENVYIQGYDAGAAVGDNRGIHTTVTDFYSLATMKAHSCYGIATDLWGGSITFNRVYNANGPLDSKGGSNATNSYATKAGGNGAVVVSQEVMKGKQATITMFGLGDKFMATDSYPVLTLFAETINNEDLLGNPPFEGEGTEEAPYLISDASDLRNMVGLGGLGAYFELTNDIYVNDVKSVDWHTGTVNNGYSPEPWFKGNNENGTGYISYLDANEAFEGTVNGNGYAVHGIYYELGNNSTVAGLLPYVSNANISNLGIEDSFIGSGRFTGGFAGYGNTINLSGCWIDDSCSVFGWDAGADYVNADSDVNTTGGGSGLCRGSATYTYKESATGTYILDGETYRTFTAADYDGTKYTYDEETETYTESESGTYLLEGETYRLITINDYTGTRYAVDDVIFTSVVFTSNALGGLVGRYMTSGTIDNCYVTANVKSNPIYAFGQEGQGVTFKNPGKCGGGTGHTGGLWGDDYASGTTKIVAASNCFSVINGHENVANATFENVYTLAASATTGITKVSLAAGNKGLDEMPGLDRGLWYAVKDSTDYPQLRLRGTVIGDVDENGKGAEFGDLTMLRKTLIDTENAVNTDTNRDGTTNVCDLVAISVKATAKAAADAEQDAKLLDTVYVSTAGSDNYVGSEIAPVATLGKAIELVKDGGTVVVSEKIKVASIPESDKTVNIVGGVLDCSEISTLSINTGLILADDAGIKFADDSSILANGNTFVVNKGTSVEGVPAAIYGGGNNAVATTNLTLKAGNYKAIYGGGNTGAVLGNTVLNVADNVNATLPLTTAGASYIYGGGNTGTVYGDTNVNVSGSVNEPLDYTSHTAIARLYGGSQNGNVKGSTFVSITENAEFNYIYGGCKSGTVGGATNIDFNAYAMSIYGGSGTVTETNVTVNGGWVHQVFGGLEGGTMTGNTNVTIKGGYIDRRIVGGCYNNATRSGFSMKYDTERYVTGNTTVTLYDEATYNLDGDDYGVTALSRHSTNHEAENGTLIFENSALQTKLENKLGIRWILGTLAPASDNTIVQ